MPAAGTPRSASAAKIRFKANGGNVALYFATWKVDTETNWADTTNFESGGYEQQVACVSKALVSLEGFLDAGQNPFDPPVQLFDGNELEDVYLYLDQTESASAWIFNLLDVLSCSTVANVKDDLKFSARCKSNGAWLFPTGSF